MIAESFETVNGLKRIRVFNNDKLNWCVRGQHGAIHIWCASNFGHGGVEMHSHAAPYDWSKPHTSPGNPCWLIGETCYHDGSSMWWYEHGRSLVSSEISYQSDQMIWQELESWYCVKFKDAIEAETAVATAG